MGNSWIWSQKTIPSVYSKISALFKKLERGSHAQSVGPAGRGRSAKKLFTAETAEIAENPRRPLRRRRRNRSPEKQSVSYGTAVVVRSLPLAVQ